jgi:GTP cyclohydrolase I
MKRTVWHDAPDETFQEILDLPIASDRRLREEDLMSDASAHFAAFLKALGFEGDPELDGTPMKVAELMAEFSPKADAPAMELLPTESSEPILLEALPFHSLCAHHLVPFFGHAKIAYLPTNRIAGFGAIVRALHHFARQPQLQERLGQQIAEHLLEALGARAVLVELESRQMCLEMRGAKSPGTIRTVHRATASTDSPDHPDLRLLEKMIYG